MSRYNVAKINWKDRRIDEIQFTPASLGVKLEPNSNVCSVVAVAFALNLTFDDAYELLMFEGYSQRKLFNTPSVISEVLNGIYTFHKVPSKEILSVLEFIKTGPPSNNVNKPYLIFIPRHIFYYSRGVIYDGQLRENKYYVFRNRKMRLKRLEQPVIAYYECNDG